MGCGSLAMLRLGIFWPVFMQKTGKSGTCLLTAGVCGDLPVSRFLQVDCLDALIMGDRDSDFGDDIKWWYVLDSNLSSIRSCVERYVSSDAGDLPYGMSRSSRFSVKDFDAAYTRHDKPALEDILQETLSNSPNNDGMYYVPGFAKLLDLLNGAYAFYGECILGG